MDKGTGLRASAIQVTHARQGAFVLATCVVLAGCSTELRTVRVKAADAIPLAGAPYNLTFTQYEVTVARRLAGCVNDTTKANEMIVALDISVTRKEVRDPKREYIIDFSALRSFFKTSNITVEYHDNGALKSVNAAADDKTATVLSSVFTSVGKLAGVSAPAATTTVAMTAIETTVGCTSTIAGILQGVAAQEATVKAKTVDMAIVTADLERLTAMGAAMGRAWGKNERAELGKQINLLYETRRELAKANDALKESLSKLAITTTVVWPPGGETRASPTALIPALTREQMKPWGSPSDANYADLQAGTAVWTKLRTTSPIGRTVGCANDICADDEVSGLKYRMPAPGQLLVCTSTDCTLPTDKSVAFVDSGLMSQLGPVLALPLKNYPFMKQSIEATFNDAGQPTKLGYKDESAGAEGAAGVFGSLVDEVIKAKEARKPKTEVERLKEETELLKARAELAAAKKALEPPKFSAQADAVATYTADTSVLQAELAKLQAAAALAAAQAQANKP